jgi:serine/threonine protein kinase
VKLGDFGCSLNVEGTQRITSTLGTPEYNSPELIQDNGVYKFKSDIW